MSRFLNLFWMWRMRQVRSDKSIPYFVEHNKFIIGKCHNNHAKVSFYIHNPHGAGLKYVRYVT